MALIAKPANYTNDDASIVDKLNTLKNTIYDEFGVTGSTGNIDDANIKSGAAITPSKIADTAIVGGNTVSPGEQSLGRPTRLSARTQYKEAELGGWSWDEDDTQTVDINGVTTFALTAGKGAYIITTTGAETLTTITGGQEGDVIYIMSADTELTVTHTLTSTVSSIHLSSNANWVVNTDGIFVIKLRCSAWAGNLEWFQV